MKSTLRRLAWVFTSRKNQTAIVTVIMALAAKYKFNLDPEIIYMIVGLGATLIAAIAAEDMGEKAGKAAGENIVKAMNGKK